MGVFGGRARRGGNDEGGGRHRETRAQAQRRFLSFDGERRESYIRVSAKRRAFRRARLRFTVGSRGVTSKRTATPAGHDRPPGR
jgi:hypothetical protein